MSESRPTCVPCEHGDHRACDGGAECACWNANHATRPSDAASLAAAWEALYADILDSVDRGDWPEDAFARHRPAIEAAIRADTPTLPKWKPLDRTATRVVRADTPPLDCTVAFMGGAPCRAAIRADTPPLDVRLSDDEWLGDTLHHSAHPGHDWHQCAYPDIWYIKAVEFRARLAAEVASEPKGTEPREPWTAAGRALLGALRLLDSLDSVARETPVDWAHGILAIEAEAAETARRDAAERVWGVRATGHDVYASAWNDALDWVIAYALAARLAADTEAGS